MKSRTGRPLGRRHRAARPATKRQAQARRSGRASPRGLREPGVPCGGPTAYQSLAQILFCLPSKPQGGHQEPRKQKGKPRYREEGLAQGQTPALPRMPCRLPQAALRPRSTRLTTWAWGCLGTAVPPPAQRASQVCRLWEGCGLGVEAAPLLPLLSGHWPFKAAGCQGLSQGYPKGRVWSGTRGPFSCCTLLPPPGSPQAGLGGRRGGAWQRQGQT